MVIGGCGSGGSRTGVGGVVVVLGYGVFYLGMVWWWFGRLLHWCWLLEGEVSCEEGGEFVLGLVGVCHFDGVCGWLS